VQNDGRFNTRIECTEHASLFETWHGLFGIHEGVALPPSQNWSGFFILALPGEFFYNKLKVTCYPVTCDLRVQAQYAPEETKQQATIPRRTQRYGS